MWNSGVNPPAGGSYSGSLVKFGQIADWGPDDPAKLRQGQEAKAFQQGLPVDPRAGQTDAKAIAGTALKYAFIKHVIRNDPHCANRIMALITSTYPQFRN